MIHIISDVLLPSINQVPPAPVPQAEPPAPMPMTTSQAALGPAGESGLDPVDAAPAPLFQPTDTALLYCSSVFQVISLNPQLTNLTFYLRATGLDSVLSNKRLRVTLFAPTDYAFGVLAGQLGVNTTDFVNNRTQLEALLAYHTVTSAM